MKPMTYQIDTLGYLNQHRPEHVIKYAETKAGEILEQLLRIAQGKTLDPKRVKSELVAAKLLTYRRKHGLFDKAHILCEPNRVSLTFLGPEA